MPRMIRFGTDPDKFSEDAVVYYLAADGRSMMARAGDAVLAAFVAEPTAEQFVAGGLASYEGEDDGGGVKKHAVTRALRKVCKDLDLLTGPSAGWTIDEMLAAIRAVKATDDAALAAFIQTHESQPPAQAKGGGAAPASKARAGK